MVLDFAWLPPEINSARIFAGAGSGPLHVAATAWDGLAQDLSASAASFDSVIVGLTAGPWAGPASASMAAAATPYVGWLTAAAGQAAAAAAQARAAAAAFETALAGTIHPAAVTGNRTTLATLIATNFFGLNAPAIASTEFQYVEMWAADVGAMMGYHTTSTAVASTLTQFDTPPTSLAGLTSWMSQLGAQVVAEMSSVESQATAVMSSLGSSVTGVLSGAGSALSGVSLSSLESAASGLSPLTSVAQIAMYPASMAISPLMSVFQMASSSSAGSASLAAANAAGLAGDATKFVGSAVPDLKPFGGAGGLGGGMGADLGKARLVGAMSVPPTWQGSMPARMVSSAMSGMGGMPNAAAAMAGAAQGGAGGFQPMPMPMGGMGAGGGMPGGMMGRGGASPHVLQNRPSVIPRTGV
jgi:PPE-repeat protein